MCFYLGEKIIFLFRKIIRAAFTARLSICRSTNIETEVLSRAAARGTQTNITILKKTLIS